MKHELIHIDFQKGELIERETIRPGLEKLIKVWELIQRISDRFLAARPNEIVAISEQREAYSQIQQGEMTVIGNRIRPD